MKRILLLLIVFSSCSSKKQLIYLQNKDDFTQILVQKNNFFSKIEIGDILKIDIQTVVPEASIPYNENQLTNKFSQNLNYLKFEGYTVDKEYNINFPVLGNINVRDLTTESLEVKIKNLLISGGHLTNPSVRVNRVNFKFTVIGEVNRPGTYSYYEESLNIFQALGYAGDLTIVGKRDNITLIRETNGVRKLNEISLKDKTLLSQEFYKIKNNDVIIVNPNFSKVKSAGFIGSASSIASISSLLLNITLLLLR